MQRKTSVCTLPVMPGQFKTLQGHVYCDLLESCIYIVIYGSFMRNSCKGSNIICEIVQISRGPDIFYWGEELTNLCRVHLRSLCQTLSNSLSDIWGSPHKKGQIKTHLYFLSFKHLQQ